MKAGSPKRWKCVWCLRRFIRPESHRCNTGMRKHHMKWLVFDRRYKSGVIEVPRPKL